VFWFVFIPSLVGFGYIVNESGVNFATVLLGLILLIQFFGRQFVFGINRQGLADYVDECDRKGNRIDSSTVPRAGSFKDGNFEMKARAPVIWFQESPSGNQVGFSEIQMDYRSRPWPLAVTLILALILTAIIFLFAGEEIVRFNSGLGF